MPQKGFAAADTVYEILPVHGDRLGIILTNEDDTAVMRFKLGTSAREAVLAGQPIFPKDTIMLYLMEGDKTRLALFMSSDTIVVDKLTYEEKIVSEEDRQFLFGIFRGLSIGV